MTDWTIITRSLRSRLFSTVTTVVTVGVAVALMLVLLTMRDAGRKAFERGSGNMHLLLSRDASPLVSVLNGIFYAGAPRAPILWREFEAFAASSPRVDWAVPVQLGDSFRSRWPVLATTPEFFNRYSPDETGWDLANGRYFDKDFEIVLGAAAARGTGLKVGDEVTLTHGYQPRGEVAGHEHGEFEYHVVGVLRPTGTAHDRAVFTSLQSTWIIHAHDRREAEERKAGGGTAEEEADDHDHDEHAHEGDDHESPTTAADVTDEDRKITNIYVRVRTREGSDAGASVAVVFDQLRRGQGFPGSSVTVASPSQEIGKLFTIVSNIDQIFLAIAAAVMVSSGIAIMLALYNSMEQRRRQVAVLRVLGASRGRVFGLIITESAVIGLLGAAAGIALAAIGAWVGAGVMKQRLGLVIEPELSATALIAVIIATIVLASLAGLAPAMVAYRTAVAKNLRPLG
jgi:putative ABC transport system permease protein